MSLATGKGWGTAVLERPSSRLPHGRLLNICANLRPGEGASVAAFFGYAFLLLVCYYLLKTLREPLLLGESSAEVKSYAYATIALVLLFLVPVYSALFRRADRTRLVRWITIFFVAIFLVFYLLGSAGANVSFLYYVCVGIFGVTVITQFWAHAADAFSVASGRRLFPVILAGATLGGLAGPVLFRVLFPALGPWSTMLIASALLAATLPVVEWSRNSVPPSSRSGAEAADPAPCPHVLGGFSLVLRDRCLLLLAVLVVLLNCVNTTGEYLLTELVLRYADAQAALRPGLDRSSVVASFYGNFFFLVNTLTVVTQFLVVGRVFRWIGVQGAVLVLPAIALIGYALTAFLPIFGILRIVKVLENSTDYSLMNTTRHALYLPLSRAAKYEGKTAIDTFFWRFGDVLQAGLIFAGLNWFGFGFQGFALLNMGLACLWLLVAARLAGSHREKTAQNEEPSIAPAPGPWPVGIPSVSWITRGSPRRRLSALLAAAIGGLALTGSVPAEAARGGLFEKHEPLEMQLFVDMKALCRNPERRGCEDTPATLLYTDARGREQRVDASLRARGRWRRESGNCSFPALFVFFDGGTEGTLFEGESILPLTTHCHARGARYEQYVLREYLAYRIYNLLTEKSLRVRLVHVTYHDTSRRAKPIERFAFFAEHFDSLARRVHARVWKPQRFDTRLADPNELAVLDLFEYMIGNTDWSTVYRHNIVLIRDEEGLVTAVPYDFDFSGLVDAAYAGPPPQLPIRTVRERLFRGFCWDETDWQAVFARFGARRTAAVSLVERTTGMSEAVKGDALEYLSAFFRLLDSPARREAEIEGACR
jgi:AAA family ATP:ADP antiporter